MPTLAELKQSLDDLTMKVQILQETVNELQVIKEASSNDTVRYSYAELQEVIDATFTQVKRLGEDVQRILARHNQPAQLDHLEFTFPPPENITHLQTWGTEVRRIVQEIKS